MATFGEFAADLTLNVIKYLNVIDASRLAATSRRYYYLVKEYQQQRGAELVVVAEANARTKMDDPNTFMARQCVHGLQTKPNLILSFSSDVDASTEVQSKLEQIFHNRSRNSPSTVFLGAIANSIQVNNALRDIDSQSSPESPTIEHDSKVSFLAANFPNVKVLPFKVTLAQRDVEMLLLERQIQAVPDLSTWKVMILYAADEEGHEMVRKFVSQLQRLLPHMVIVGGMCNSGYVSKPTIPRSILMGLTVAQLRQFPETHGFHFVEKSELVEHIRVRINEQTQDRAWVMEAGLFGIILGGDVPVKSIVSRGVKSVFHGKPQSFSPFVVDQAQFVDTDDLFRQRHTFGFQVQDLAYHVLTKVRDTDSQKVMSTMEFISQSLATGHRAVFVGIKRPGSDGFRLEALNHHSGVLVILTDGSPDQAETIEGAQIDLFYLDERSCMEDMDEAVKKLRRQTENEEILGAIMFSCVGRGPTIGHLICEEMSDAKRFAKGFPTVPCLGFYAGGEIGPAALTGHENVFQTGGAAYQEFTAVFALFIVPKPVSFVFQLNDTPENVQAFVSTRLDVTTKPQ